MSLRALSERISASVGRGYTADSKRVPMLLDTDDSFHSTTDFQMTTVESTKSAMIVTYSNPSHLRIAIARAQDTEHLRRPNNVFFTLFKIAPPDPRATTHRRAQAAEWSDINPIFISKLLVSDYTCSAMRTWCANPVLLRRSPRRSKSRMTKGRSSLEMAARVF